VRERKRKEGRKEGRKRGKEGRRKEKVYLGYWEWEVLSGKLLWKIDNSGDSHRAIYI
jgi:hypothetical protein